MKVCVECGQKWWRYSSWVTHNYPKGLKRANFFRKLRYSRGFAVGPIIVLFKEGRA